MERWIRRVATLEPPWKLCTDLGEVEVQGWCPTYDGRRWGVFEGDDVRVLLRVVDGLEEEWTDKSFWPTSISRCPQGLWLETSSLGASHYEILALPDLTALAWIGQSGGLLFYIVDLSTAQLIHSFQWRVYDVNAPVPAGAAKTCWWPTTPAEFRSSLCKLGRPHRKFC